MSIKSCICFYRFIQDNLLLFSSRFESEIPITFTREHVRPKYQHLERSIAKEQVRVENSTKISQTARNHKN